MLCLHAATETTFNPQVTLNTRLMPRWLVRIDQDWEPFRGKGQNRSSGLQDHLNHKRHHPIIPGPRVLVSVDGIRSRNAFVLLRLFAESRDSIFAYRLQVGLRWRIGVTECIGRQLEPSLPLALHESSKSLTKDRALVRRNGPC